MIVLDKQCPHSKMLIARVPILGPLMDIQNSTSIHYSICLGKFVTVKYISWIFLVMWYTVSVSINMIFEINYCENICLDFFFIYLSISKN